MYLFENESVTCTAYVYGFAGDLSLTDHSGEDARGGGSALHHQGLQDGGGGRPEHLQITLKTSVGPYRAVGRR